MLVTKEFVTTVLSRFLTESATEQVSEQTDFVRNSLFEEAPHIDPSHEGRLHKALGIPYGHKIPASALNRAKHSKNPHMRQMANFAKNAKHWDHDVNEDFRQGDDVQFNHNGRMKHGRVVRVEKNPSDRGSSFAVVNHGGYESAKVPFHKLQKVEGMPLLEAVSFNKGDRVVPNEGPHAGHEHEIIHKHPDGTFNIKPTRIPAHKISYRLGAARCHAGQIEHIDEADYIGVSESVDPDTTHPEVHNFRREMRNQHPEYLHSSQKTALVHSHTWTNPHNGHEFSLTHKGPQFGGHATHFDFVHSGGNYDIGHLPATSDHMYSAFRQGANNVT